MGERGEVTTRFLNMRAWPGALARLLNANNDMSVRAVKTVPRATQVCTFEDHKLFFIPNIAIKERRNKRPPVDSVRIQIQMHINNDANILSEGS